MADTENLAMREFAENLWRFYIEDKVRSMMESPYPMWKSYRAKVISVNGDNTMTVQAPFDQQVTIPYVSSAASLSAGDQCTVLIIGSAVNSVVIGDGKLSNL